MIIGEEVKIMRKGFKDKRDAEAWGFEWDNIERAAKEMRESTFGPDKDIHGTEKFCFQCGESDTEENRVFPSEFCPFCGYSYEESKLARKFMALHVDVAWKLMNAEQRTSFKREVKALRSVSPEFRQMWQKEADQGALDRRYG
jgi:hypothetical protein